MLGETKIKLDQRFFTREEKVIVKDQNLTAVLFEYRSGIKAVKLSNKLGYLTILPYRGQQVWDVCFNSRYLRMKTNFEEPRDVANFTDTYGAFLMHCGALRMGCPGPEDNHPLHGELPYAKFVDAELKIGEDEKGRYIGLTSSFEYNKAFTAYYIARPEVKLYDSSSVIDIGIQIDNKSNYPMELMYMVHINFLPVDQGEILQTVKWNKDSMKIRESLPGNVESNQEYAQLINKLKEEPALTQKIEPEYVYDPEVVYYFDNIMEDSKGLAHFMQKHPDGSADYVSFKVDELDHGTRWLVKNKDIRALGIVLPSTCDADGYIAEKKKGNVRTIEGQGTFKANLQTGYLDKKQADKIEEVIKSVVKN